MLLAQPVLVAIREEAMSRGILARSLGIIGLAVIMVAPPAWAQDAPLVRVRGTIERVDGPIYVVKARDGTELKLTLADKPSIAALVKASLSDIKQGSFVGVTSMPQADGSVSALEVHIFPEEMRGTGGDCPCKSLIGSGFAAKYLIQLKTSPLPKLTTRVRYPPLAANL